MASFFNTLSGLPSTLFIKFENHVHNSGLASEIRYLKTLDDHKTQDIYLGQLQSFLLKEVEELAQKILTYNGSYYQDPDSKLKIAWDKTVEVVQTALSIELSTREQLNSIQESAKSISCEEDKTTVLVKIHLYTAYEKNRDKTQEQLEKIIGTIKNLNENFQTELIEEKTTLEQKRLTLSGKFYADPTSLVDQAWKKYQQESSENKEKKDQLHGEYLQLDIQRRQLDASLYYLEKKIAAEENFDSECISQTISTKIQSIKRNMR